MAEDKNNSEEKPEVVFVENPRGIKAMHVIGAPEAHRPKPKLSEKEFQLQKDMNELWGKKQISSGAAWAIVFIMGVYILHLLGIID